MTFQTLMIRSPLLLFGRTDLLFTCARVFLYRPTAEKKKKKMIILYISMEIESIHWTLSSAWCKEGMLNNNNNNNRSEKQMISAELMFIKHIAKQRINTHTHTQNNKRSSTLFYNLLFNVSPSHTVFRHLQKCNWTIGHPSWYDTLILTSMS